MRVQFVALCTQTGQSGYQKMASLVYIRIKKPHNFLENRLRVDITKLGYFKKAVEMSYRIELSLK